MPENLFFHEKRAKLIAEQQAALAEFDSREPEYNVVYDILDDIITSYPGLYIHHLDTFTSIAIPRDMTTEQFNQWLDYLEDTYLTEYNLVRNEVDGLDIVAEYIHGETDGQINLKFSISQCQIKEKMEYKKTYITECNWE